MTTADATAVDRSAWLALSVIVAAGTMVALDTTIVNIALHDISVDLDAGAGVEWVVTAYLLGVCASQPASGWLADRCGRKESFLASLAVFTLASAACALAPSLAVLVVARLVQGFGGGVLLPVGMSTVLGIFPRARHGRAVGIWGLSAMLAPAFGPTLGGWLVTSISWHWLFLINVPIGVVTFVLALRLVPDVGDRHRRAFDSLGLVLGCGGLSLAVLGLSEGSAWGWGSVATLGCLAAGGTALAIFVPYELRIGHPLLDLRMFGERTFRVAIAVTMLTYVGFVARLVFLPLALEGLRGETALTVGVLFLPAALLGAAGMTIGGRMVDRIGPRRPVVIGTAMMLITAGALARFSLDTPLGFIGVVLAIQGFGYGLMTAPALVAGLSELPARLVTQGTALRGVLVQVAAALTVAVLGAVVATRAGTNPSDAHAQSAYNDAFLVATICAVIALGLAIRLPRHRAGHELDELDDSLAPHATPT